MERTEEEEVEAVPFPDRALEMFVVIEEIGQEQGPEPAFPISRAVLELQKNAALCRSAVTFKAVLGASPK